MEGLWLLFTSVKCFLRENILELKSMLEKQQYIEAQYIIYVDSATLYFM